MTTEPNAGPTPETDAAVAEANTLFVQNTGIAFFKVGAVEVLTRCSSKLEYRLAAAQAEVAVGKQDRDALFNLNLELGDKLKSAEAEREKWKAIAQDRGAVIDERTERLRAAEAELDRLREHAEKMSQLATPAPWY